MRLLSDCYLRLLVTEGRKDFGFESVTDSGLYSWFFSSLDSSDFVFLNGVDISFLAA